jgi:hypothetical protein
MPLNRIQPPRILGAATLSGPLESAANVADDFESAADAGEGVSELGAQLLPSLPV